MNRSAITTWRNSTFPLRAVLLSALLLGGSLETTASAQDGFLAYSTYLVGNGADKVHAITNDELGNVYITGETYSSDLPVTTGAAQQQHAGTPGTVNSVFEPVHPVADAFVIKLAPTGELLYATYLGGPGYDAGQSIAVDAQGSAYVLGWTLSGAFPTTPGALQTSLDSRGPRLFVTKLNPSGSEIVYSTLLGGAEGQFAGAIAVDTSGNAYVAGATSSRDFPVTPGAVSSTFPAGASQIPFVSKLDAAGGALLYSTFLGGSGDGIARGIAVDADGKAYLSGETMSSDFPATAGAIDSAGSNAFAMKLNAAGTAVLYAARFGAETSIVANIAIDSSGSAWIAGATDAGDFPTTDNAFQRQPGGGYDAWVVKLNETASEMVYAARLGGDQADFATRIAVDALGNAIIAGSTASADFPLSRDGRPLPASQCFNDVNSPFPPPAQLGSCGEGFLAKLDPSGSTLLYSTILGGADLDVAEGVAVDAAGNAYVAGTTRSNNFPTTQVALSNRRSPANCTLVSSPTFSQTTFCEDGFVAKVGFGEPPAPPAVQVFNLGSLEFAPLAPESVVKLAGVGIGPSVAAALQLDASGRVATELSKTRVLFDGEPAPLLMVSADEINLIVPGAVRQRERARIEIEREGNVSASLSIGAVPAAPSLLTLDGSGKGQAAAINIDGTVNTIENPAARGSVIALYAVGFGFTHEPDGSVAAAAHDLSMDFAPDVRINGEPAEVLYAGLAPGLISAAIQINVRIPEISDDHAGIVVLTHGYATQAGTTIAIE